MKALRKNYILTVILVLILMLLAGCAGLSVREIQTSREPESIQGVLNYIVQVGLFETQQEALDASSKAKEISKLSVRIMYQPPFYRVMAGSFKDLGEAEIMVEYFRKHGFPDARWVYDNKQQ